MAIPRDDELSPEGTVKCVFVLWYMSLAPTSPYFSLYFKVNMFQSFGAKNLWCCYLGLLHPSPKLYSVPWPLPWQSVAKLATYSPWWICKSVEIHNFSLMTTFTVCPVWTWEGPARAHHNKRSDKGESYKCDVSAINRSLTLICVTLICGFSNQHETSNRVPKRTNSQCSNCRSMGYETEMKKKRYFSLHILYGYEYADTGRYRYIYIEHSKQDDWEWFIVVDSTRSPASEGFVSVRSEMRSSLHSYLITGL